MTSSFVKYTNHTLTTLLAVFKSYCIISYVHVLHTITEEDMYREDKLNFELAS